MNLFHKILTGTALAAVAFGAQAVNVATGSLWHVPESVVNNPTGATFANVPLSPADVTFSVATPFNFNGTGLTVGQWLASSSAFNVVGSAGVLGSPMDNFSTGSILYFTGFVTVTTGQTFAVTHDDGLTLRIGGLDVISAPGPTSPIPTTGTYTGVGGNLPFQLVYTECCSGPAVLQIDLPFTAAVPEPETYALMLGGLAALGFVSRRRRQS